MRSSKPIIAVTGILIAYVALRAAVPLITGWESELQSALIGQILWGAGFFIGLVWVIRLLEAAAQAFEVAHRSDRGPRTPTVGLSGPPGYRQPGRRSWNPFDPQAWYYGRAGGRLQQSLAALAIYSIVFLTILFAWAHWDGVDAKDDGFETPGGGGGSGGMVASQARPQTARIKKVVQKKFIINPYSSINFYVPPIEQIDVKLLDDTRNEYKVGQGAGTGLGNGSGSGIGEGDGEGAGFGGGTGKGEVRFVRLKYEGGDWDQNMGPGGDVNMLIEYHARTRQRVARESEFLTAAQLKSLPAVKSPPIMYLTGQKSILLRADEKKILREYMLDRHGMIFGDNGGSAQFHQQFVTLMRELTGVREVVIPQDDIIHRRPFQLTKFPYVAPHGGRLPLGWKMDGRWLCYYHPGNIADAWKDGHSGVPRDIYEDCYTLGVNIIYYAYSENSKWRMAQSGR